MSARKRPSYMIPPPTLYSVEIRDNVPGGKKGQWTFLEHHITRYKEGAEHTAKKMSGRYYDVITEARVVTWKRKR